jgi:hypothetical protein
LDVATDYDGTYGDPSLSPAQPPSPVEPAYAGTPEPGSGPPGAEPPDSGSARWPRPAKVSFLIAVTALVLGAAGLAVSLYGVATQLLPRHFTAQQQQQITNWEYGKRWRQLTAGQIFPAAAKYAPAAALEDDPTLSTLPARRIGVAKQASCRSATDAAAAAVLHRDGCEDLLRATYTDGTGSYVVTIGVAVLPGVAQADAAVQSLASAADVDGIGPGVRALSFRNTAAGWFTNARRQVSGAISAGTYVVLYTAGYADSRPKQPVAKDSYGDAEMTGAAMGVAKAVRAVLAAPVTPASCPGAAGC